MMLKLSGEVLAGDGGSGLDDQVLLKTAFQLVKALHDGARLAVVLGGGNIFRGLSVAAKDMDRVTADQMGMLATVINGLSLKDAIERSGGDATLFTAFPIGAIGRPYRRDDVRFAMDNGVLAILSGGTGNPFFSTDSAAALRAAELGCQVLLKGTKVDGVYDKDPATHGDAQRFDVLNIDEVLQRRLGVVDLTAAMLCRENHIDLRVYRMTEENIIYRVATGESCGTLVTSD
jgi:uridylate kinase